jgi:hypothetical protein
MSDASTVVGLIGASVVVLGYAITQGANRIEVRRKTYADALAALNSLMELPYWIARRTEDSPEMRQHIADRTRTAQQDLSYFVVVLDLDSAPVRTGFRQLVAKTRAEGHAHRRATWQMPPAQSDSDMSTDMSFPYSNELAFESCLSAIWRELTIYAALRPRRR